MSTSTTSNDATPAAAAVAAAAAAAEPAPSATYNASCHCGAVAYRVTVSPPLDHPASSVSSCNCSICVRNGYLLIYVPNKDVEFEKGEGAMTKYTFAQERVQHSFCPTCGSSLMAQSIKPDYYPDIKAINVRAFHDVDISKLNIKEADGKSA